MSIKVSKRKKMNRSMGGNILMMLVLFLAGFVMLLPLIYVTVTAFKPVNELFLFPPRFFVQNPTTDNFTDMFKLLSTSQITFWRYLFNSVFVSVVGTVFTIILSSLAAYPLAKHRFAGRILLYNIVVWALLFRGEVTSAPQYIIVTKLGMLNTYWAILVPMLAGSMGVFLMRQFMESNIPDAILEAAKIDGAGEFYTFWKIAMPMVRPAWLTLLIFTFQGVWNATGGEFIYSEPMKMLPTALNQIVAAGVSRAGASSAVSLIQIIPPIVLFIISQSSVMETMSTSGIK